MNGIKEELGKVNPSPKKIISLLFNLRINKEGIEFAPKDEWRYLQQAEFFNIIGEIFNRNPEFYMKYLYRRIIKRIRKLTGIDKLMEMEVNIIEKYCLGPEEQILLKFEGGFQFKKYPTLGSSVVWTIGNLYVTNNRIIVCPSKGLKVRRGTLSTGLSSRARIVNHSLQEKCYGYMFPTKNISKLKKTYREVNYNVVLNNKNKNITINIFKSSTRQEDINKLLEILSIK